jgi:predicted nucleic acid-binding protein
MRRSDVERRIQTMSDSGPYLFDVGVVALAHADTPVSERALSYVQEAIAGEIEAIVRYPTLFGAHVVLSSYYGFSNADASRLMQNFMDAERVQWYRKLPESTVRDSFDQAGELNIDGWDGYYAQVALEEGAETILTLDDDFERLDGVSTNVILSSEEFATLNEFLGG